MRFRGLLVGAVVLLVLAGLVFWSERSKESESATKSAGETPKLVTLNSDDVQRVDMIRQGNAEPVVLEKDKSGSWQLTAPKPARADSETVGTLVSTFTTLSWDRLVEEKAANLSEFGLDRPALQIGLTAKSGQKQTLLIGDDTPTGGGAFAKLQSDARVFAIHSGTKGSLDKTWSDLRDKRLLTFDEGKITRVEVAAKGQTFEFGKNAGGDWQLVKPRPLRADNHEVSELVRKLQSARFEGEAAEAAGSARIGSAAITDASGTQTIEIRKKGNDYLARSSVLEGFFKVSNDLGEAFTKGVEDYRNKKLFDFGFNDPNKIELRDGEKNYSFVKGGEKWWSNGKEMDAPSVQSLIDKLRDLSAAKFVETGFTTPVVEATVTSGEGKRVEKVLISKAGERWIAKRDAEPSLYELDAARAQEIGRAAADVKAPPPPAQPAAKK